jgi:hypothetical protein
MQAFGVDATTQLASSYLSKSLETPGKGSTERLWGRRFQTGEVKRLLLQYNVMNIHWISVEINVTNHVLSFGDSKPGVTQKVLPILPTLRSMLIQWLDVYLPNISWTTNLKGIRVPLQLDSTSCGIATLNAVHNRLIPMAPIWDPKRPGKMRAYFFCRCVALGKGVSLFTVRTVSKSDSILQIQIGIREFFDADNLLAIAPLAEMASSGMFVDAPLTDSDSKPDEADHQEELYSSDSSGLPSEESSISEGSTNKPRWKSLLKTASARPSSRPLTLSQNPIQVLHPQKACAFTNTMICYHPYQLIAAA